MKGLGQEFIENVESILISMPNLDDYSKESVIEWRLKVFGENYEAHIALVNIINNRKSRLRIFALAVLSNLLRENLLKPNTRQFAIDSLEKLTDEKDSAIKGMICGCLDDARK